MERLLSAVRRDSLRLCFAGCLVVGLVCGLTASAEAQAVTRGVYPGTVEKPLWQHLDGTVNHIPPTPEEIARARAMPVPPRLKRLMPEGPKQPATRTRSRFNRRPAQSQRFESANFVVVPRGQVAGDFLRRCLDELERQRKSLAIEWLGKELPPWKWKTDVAIRPTTSDGGGTTSFGFAGSGGLSDSISSSIVGKPERIITDVIPHETMHMVLATHFGRPLPRWLDEGICTAVESSASRNFQRKLLIHFLKNGHGIPFSTMLPLAQYPRDILPLYSQGFSVADFLLEHGGKRELIAFVETGLGTGRWEEAIGEHYCAESLGNMQNTWLEWVKAGSQRAPNDGSGYTWVVSRAAWAP